MQCQFLIKNISLEIMNSTKIHHQYFAGLLQFPEIFGNCRMTRKKGSANKMIHFKTRNSLDIQKICDASQLLDGTNPPEHWLLRLIDISENPPYIIDIKNTGITASQFVLSDYITPDLKLKAGAPMNLIFEKPSQRNNDNLFFDIDCFVQNVFNYYLNRWNDEDSHDYIKIRGEVLNLKNIARRGLNNTHEKQYHRLFLLNDGKSNNFKPIQCDHSLNGYADLNIFDHWHLSWSVFWRAMSQSIDKLSEQFVEPKFYFKLKNRKHVSNFNQWLQEGLSNYLEPTNPKIESDNLHVSHLKFLILSKADRKK